LLINLLDRLTLPPELDAKLAALREQLLAPIDAADLPGALQGVCDLVAEMRRKVQREKEDLEQFLAQLTTRLQELDERLSGTRSENEASRMSGQALNVAVSAEVSHIASTMRDAADLDVLKKLVQDRLEEIRRHMDAYRAAEDDRHKQTDEKVRALLDRLRELEDETSSLRNRVREQRSEALRDTLTGIFNRLAYDERIDQEFLRWKRFNEPVSVMVWDVDFFKSINDTYGHKAGDKVLVSIAKMLASQIRETDFIARYGGEEFVIVAPGSDAATSLKVADKLRQSIEQKGFRHRDAPVPVTISCGIAEFKAGSTPDSVFEAADQALYQAKQEGRNRCVVAS
jgi:diguanylate cyclase